MYLRPFRQISVILSMKLFHIIYFDGVCCSSANTWLTLQHRKNQHKVFKSRNNKKALILVYNLLNFIWNTKKIHWGTIQLWFSKAIQSKIKHAAKFMYFFGRFVISDVERESGKRRRNNLSLQRGRNSFFQLSTVKAFDRRIECTNYMDIQRIDCI